MAALILLTTMILIIMIIIMRMMNTKNLEALGFDRDYYRPIRNDSGFDGRRNNYIEYKIGGIDMRICHPKNILI